MVFLVDPWDQRNTGRGSCPCFSRKRERAVEAGSKGVQPRSDPSCAVHEWEGVSVKRGGKEGL